MIEVSISLRTGRGLNDRMHRMARVRSVKAERHTAYWYLHQAAPFFGAHLTGEQHLDITLRRCSPSRGLDADNLQGALKAVRDGVADWLRIDDGSARISWIYEQARHDTWMVQIAVEVTTCESTTPA